MTSMTRVSVIVVSPEEAENGVAECWCGAELMAVTTLHEGRLQLRIESRADGGPWLVDAASLARGLAEATRQIAAW
jgi:hypothetical protein